MELSSHTVRGVMTDQLSMHASGIGWDEALVVFGGLAVVMVPRPYWGVGRDTRKVVTFGIRARHDLARSSSARSARSRRSRSIARGVGQVATAAKGLAVGDLNQRIPLESDDEIGQMAAAPREMIAWTGCCSPARSLSV